MASPIVQGPISSTLAATTPKTLAPTATVAGDTLLVVLVAQNATALTASAVTDNASGGSNVYSKVKTQTVGRYMELWECRNAKSTTSISVAQTSGAVFGATFVDIGVTTADDDIEGSGNATSTTTPPAVTATAMQAGDVGISFIHYNGNTTATISLTAGAWTKVTSGADPDGNVAWINPATSGVATGPTWTGTTSAGWGSITALYKTVQTAAAASTIAPSASLSAGATPEREGAATLAAAASVSAGATQTFGDAATLTAAASLTAGATQAFADTATIAPSASVTAGLGQILPGAATISPAASVVAGATDLRPIVATIAPSASVVAGIALVRMGIATIAPSASVIAGGTRVVVPAAVLNAVASLTAGATLQQLAAATINPQASVTAGAIEIERIASTIQAIASLVAGANLAQTAAVIITAHAFLTASAFDLQPAGPTPSERVYVVQAESRLYVVTFEDRTVIVPAESRVLEIA